MVVARSREGNTELQLMLSRRGIEAAAVEAIGLEDPESWAEVDLAIRNISSYDWVVFTSQRGVAAFARRLEALGLKIGGRGPKFAAVGPKTASALMQMGIKPEYVPERFLTSALGEGLPAEAGSRVLLLRADMGVRRLVALMEGRGLAVEEVAAYRTRFVRGLVDPGLVRGAGIIAFASPSEVEGFRRRLGPRDFEVLAGQATAACIGPVTARAAEGAGFRSVVFTEEHTLEALVEEIGRIIARA